MQELDWASVDWTYTNFGPSRAGGLGGLDPRDEMVDQTLAFVEAGMPKGEGWYGSCIAGTGDESWADVWDRNADRHYLGRHYVDYENNWPQLELFLERDDLPRFFECLFNNLAVTHQEWRVGMESIDGVPSCTPFDGDRWRGIRDMFVHERGGYDGSQQSLWLLQAIPRSWLKPNDRLSVRDMPTYFGGRVNLDVHVAEDGNSVNVVAELRELNSHAHGYRGQASVGRWARTRLGRDRRTKNEGARG